MSVIVTNARNRIAYNVVRSLGQKGIRVYAADFVSWSMSFVSRYAAGHFVYPSPFREPDAFVACLVDQIGRLDADVLIPVFEETFLIAKHRDRFPSRVSMVLPTYDQILTVHNKDRLEALARRVGIPVPATYPAEEMRAASALQSNMRFPVLIKPKQGGGAWGIQEVPSADMLAQLLARHDWTDRPWERFFIQEKINGPTHCVAMLFNHGALKATVGYRQLRDFPPTGGQATMRISCRHEKAEEYLHRLLAELRWHGPCQADFIIDGRTDEAYLIDINPRLWGSLTQAIASGVDFPYLIYRLAKDGDVPPVTTFQTDVVTRWIGGELAALPARLRNAPDKLPVVRDFFFPNKAAAMLDDLSVSDPLPFLAWTSDAVYRAMKFRTGRAVPHDSLDGIWE